MTESHVNETSRRDFELALRADAHALLEDYLPPASDPTYLPTLRELILIDLEHRWRTASGKTGARKSGGGPLVESYLDRHPELEATDLPELIEEEFIVRANCGDAPSLEEYQLRFPDVVFDLDTARVGREQPPPAAPPLQRLGDYRILREIGRGGMGVVYEAEQLALGRHVALKVLPGEALAHPQLVDRFQREARAAAQLHHTNIVPVFGVGEADGRYFYAMQFIAGAGLDDLLKELQALRTSSTSESRSDIDASEGKPNSPAATPNVARSLLQGDLAQTFVPGSARGDTAATVVPRTGTGPDGSESPTEPQAHSDTAADGSSASVLLGEDAGSQLTSNRRTLWHAVARIGVQAADGLDYAHQRGILHRDIKPANLILDQQGIVWITDFGLARIESEENLTRTGDVMGTLRYMPPEALEGSNDGRSDIFSLGLTLYELLCLQPGYNENERSRLIQSIMEANVQPLREVEPGVPRDLETIVHKCLDREPSGRYQSAGELRDDLERFLHDEPIQARRVSLLERLIRWSRRNKGVAASLATILLLLLSAAIISSLAAARFNQLAQDKEDLADQREEQRLAAYSARDEAQLRRREADAAKERAEQLAEQNRRQLYTSQMLVAAEALKIDTGIGRVRQILENWIPKPGETDLRGWEWYYLQGLCHQEEASLPNNVAKVRGLAWSQSGDGLLVAHNGSRFSEYASDWVSVRHRVEAFRGAIGVAWNRDRTRLAASGYDGQFRIFSWPDGEMLVERTLTRRYEGLGWSSNGRWVACACDDRPHLLVLQADNGEEVLRLNVDGNAPSFAFHPTEPRLAFRDGWTTRVVEIPDGSELASFEYPRVGQMTAIGWSPDGSQLVECIPGSVRIRDMESGEVTHESPASGRLSSVVWHDQGGIAVASWDGTASILNPVTGEIVRKFRGHRNWVTRLAWSPDGERLATGGPSEPPRIWNPNRQTGDFSVPGFYWSGSSWSPDSRTLAMAVQHRIHFWNVDDRREVFDRRIALPEDQRVITVEYSPDGKRLAYIQERGRIAVLNPANGDIIRVLNEGTEQRMTASQSTQLLSWSADGRRLAAMLPTGEATLWDVATGEIVTQQRPTGSVNLLSVALHPDGKRIAMGTTGGVHLWEENATEVCALSDSWAPGVAWALDGRWVIGVGPYTELFTVALIDSEQREPPIYYRGATRWANTFALSPDGTRLAAGCDDGSACVWDTESRAMVARFDDFERCIDVSWSPDGTRLTATTYGKAIIRDAETWLQPD